MTDPYQSIIGGDKPVFVLIAGPNGAGKSTFREKRLEPSGITCVDPDRVGITLFGGHPTTREEALQATQEATRLVRSYFDKGMSVALETVFSDREGYKLKLIAEAKTKGFRTVLIFIGVDDPQVSIARVMDRVRLKGHDVPDSIIEERFPRCFENLKKAIRIVDLTVLYDNTGSYGSGAQVVPGLRHYLVGTIQPGTVPQLSNPLPHWFKHYRISDSIETA